MFAVSRYRWLLSLGLWLSLASAAAAAPASGNAADASLVAQGRRIYVEGVLASGEPLQARRGPGGTLDGPEAACISCHRASGMGSVEGSVRVSPISQRYLFASEDDLVMANMDGSRGKTMSQRHAAYTDAALEVALRLGIGISGRTLNEVMPHFNLGVQDVAALTAYLRQLSAQYDPGVSKEVIRFATVITPDVSPARRGVFKEMLQSALVAKNSSTSPRKRYMTSAATFATQTERRWDVQVWELSGGPETWEAQLQARYAASPVFAILSGISDSTWAPVDAFCAAQRLPCWFPSTALPTAGDASYGLYFSRGVSLEAAVLARYLHDAATASGAAPAGQVFQVRSDSHSAASAALALDRNLQSQGRSTQTTVLSGNSAHDRAALRAVLQGATAGDAVALWLEASQLPLLEGLVPPAHAQVFVSASMAQLGAGNELTAPWRDALRVVYPFALPQDRQANLAYLHSWLKLRNIALVDEAMQSELFFALNLMTDTLQDMLDNLYRDYLIERAEDMLGRREAGKAEQENRDRQTLGRTARASVRAEALRGSVVSDAPDAQSAQQRAFGLGESAGTTVYPHLSLGPSQRFASRGAYIVRFAPGANSTLSAQSEWIVP